MDFETRQKQAVEEINEVLKKYGVALQAFLSAKETGIIPAVRLMDTVKEVETVKDVEYKEHEEHEEVKPAKKGKK